MQARVEVERLIGWSKREALPPSQLHKEVVGAVVVGVGDQPCLPDPHVDLQIEKEQQKMVTASESYSECTEQHLLEFSDSKSGVGLCPDSSVRGNFPPMQEPGAQG